MNNHPTQSPRKRATNRATTPQDRFSAVGMTYDTAEPSTRQIASYSVHPGGDCPPATPGLVGRATGARASTARAPILTPAAGWGEYFQPRPMSRKDLTMGFLDQFRRKARERVQTQADEYRRLVALAAAEGDLAELDGDALLSAADALSRTAAQIEADVATMREERELIPLAGQQAKRLADAKSAMAAMVDAGNRADAMRAEAKRIVDEAQANHRRAIHLADDANAAVSKLADLRKRNAWLFGLPEPEVKPTAATVTETADGVFTE